MPAGAFKKWVAAGAALLFLVAALAASIAGRKRVERAFSERMAELILNRVRLTYYVELVNERNQQLAELYADRGEARQAIAFCKDACPGRQSDFCAKLLQDAGSLADSVFAETKGVHEYVCFEVGGKGR